MAIPEGYKYNLNTILTAASNGDLCLLECSDKMTGKPVIVLCAGGLTTDKQITYTPLARMFDSSPYDELVPPSDCEHKNAREYSIDTGERFRDKYSKCEDCGIKLNQDRKTK